MIAIIVPVYNAEKFLDDCIRSVINQTYASWHLILVDDGSTDRSAEICRAYADGDDRIRAISFDNKGLSVARNRGLDALPAECEYVVFLDSDDTLANEALATMYGLAERTGADVVCGQYTDNLRRLGLHCSNPSIRIVSPREALRYTLLQIGFDNSVCAKMYRRSIFDTGERFRPGYNYEDLDITPRLYSVARSVCCTNAVVYYYRPNVGSFIHTWSDKRLHVLEISAEIETAMEMKGCDLRDAARDRRFAAACNIYRELVRQRIHPDIADSLWSLIRSRRGEILLRRGHRMKNRLGALLAYFSRPIFTLVMRTV